jgi:hypothetical protein
MASVVRELRKPAGDSERFADLESIEQNYDEFIRKAHSTWKRLHRKAIEEILVYDAMMVADRKRPIGPVFIDWNNYMRQLWRRVNDSIVWLMAGADRHFMKRLCLYRSRGLLAEANPESALGTINLLNSDPYSMAIWNDATSGVDIGDVTFLNKRTDQIEFFELKEGNVNEEIVAINESKSDAEYRERLKDFLDRYGAHGKKQLERVQRQSRRNEQIIDLLVHEKGLDPVTGFFIEVQTLKTKDEHYDDELRDLLTEVESAGEGYRVVDDCLWIYANQDDSLSTPQVTQKFFQILKKNEKRFELLLKKKLSSGDIGGIESINNGFNSPTSIPLFLRHLEPEQIGQIAYGSLMRRVQLFLDWETFGKLFNEAGAEFLWSTPKQARKERAKKFSERRGVIVYGRMPLVRVGDGTGSISGAALIRVMFDGIRPKTLVGQLVESLQLMLKKYESQT